MKPMDLAGWLESAWADYQCGWSAVDDELYVLCARRGHNRSEDVYAKVAVINRVYAAGLSRSVRVSGSEDPELLVATSLVESRDMIASGLAGIDATGRLSGELLRPILDLHGRVQTALEKRTGRRLTSFVSKYLHFHSPVAPIYDSLVWRAIGEVTRDLFGKATRAATPAWAVGRGDEYYRSYCTRFLAIAELAQRSGVDVSVKMLDHALWSLGRKLARRGS